MRTDTIIPRVSGVGLQALPSTLTMALSLLYTLSVSALCPHGPKMTVRAAFMVIGTVEMIL